MKTMKNVLMTAAALATLTTPALAWSKVSMQDFHFVSKTSQTVTTPTPPKAPEAPQTPKAPTAPTLPPKSPQAPQTPKTPELPKTPSGTAVQTIAKTAGFDPIILLDTIAPRNDKEAKINFKEGLFINDKNGGAYQLCGRVKKAQDLQLNNDGKAAIEINGKLFPMTVIGAPLNGDYSFCGTVDIHDLTDTDLDTKKEKHATLSKIFNNVLINLKNKKGLTKTVRHTIVNSEMRATKDVVHDGEVSLFMDNQGDEGDTMNDFMSHAINDLILSNESIFDGKAEDAFNKATQGTCNLEEMYENVQDDRNPLPWLVMQIAQGAYDFTHDLDGDETMWLCYDSFSIGDSDIQASFGDTEDDMVRIAGQIHNAQMRFDFRHSSNGFFTGYDLLESGDFVVNIGTIEIEAYVKNMRMEDGKFLSTLTIDHATLSGMDSKWENWYVNDVWYEGEDSDMDQLDEIVDGKIKSSRSFDEIEDKEIEKELSEDAVAMIFVPGSDLFEIVVDEVEVELPSSISNAYSKQDGYRTTENDGYFEIYQNHEMGIAVDDDLINHQIHLAVKDGKMDQTMTETLEDGSTVTVNFEVPVAPVVSFDGEEEYALRMDVANAEIVMVNSKNPVEMVYRADISTVLQMYSEGSGKLVNFILKESDIHLVSVKGPKAPDKLLESVMKQAINQMLAKTEEKLNSKLVEQMDAALGNMPMDICADLGGTGGNGSNNTLAVSLDLDWSETISKTDSCFKMSSTTETDVETGSYKSFYYGCNEEYEACVSEDEVYNYDYDTINSNPNYY